VLRCWCTVSGSGCSCNFTAPNSFTSNISYTFSARIDKNGDRDYTDPGEKANATLTIWCKDLNQRCSAFEPCCSPNYCTNGVCQYSGGGCPTLFVYDGKNYEKIRKSNIHSQEGIDTVDDIVLNNKPAVVDGHYLLSLKETTLPEHSYIDTVKLFAVDSEGMKELKLISARHSRLGDVTSILAGSDDLRINTKVFDSIELKFTAEEGDYFLFEVEGYNPIRPGRYKLDIADFNINKLPMIFACIFISIVSILVLFTVFKVTMRSKST
jgi:hypothetical protein